MGYIIMSEPSPMYIALVWLFPLTLGLWYQIVCTDNFEFLEKILNNQKGRRK